MRRVAVRSLFSSGVIQIGRFPLGETREVPIRLVMKLAYTYQEAMESICQLIWDQVRLQSFSHICGIAYEALPVAMALSVRYCIPTIMKSKRSNILGVGEYGDPSGQVCLLVSSAIFDGADVLEAKKRLEEAGFIIRDIVSLLDFELDKKGLENCHIISVFTATTLAKILVEEVALYYEERKILNQFLLGK
ncbi:hypothetical protein [Chlamydiifrater phoenicopteri]|uniref:hypothetical protein n=1 Tax=Chlamydiifrater phoenicopteri TaxID=2681469 RepID=UPI001BD1AF8D|nr:hypothetical protein [Chlamydiifrater phoenicopteri]